MIIRNREFDYKNHTYVMGILNVTPDSFYDGGLHNTKEEAVKCALKMVKDGADIIDIGGESTRPGAVSVTEEEELSRVIPVIEAIRGVTDIPISIDTYKAKVADCALHAGADIINDVHALSDERMPSVAARHGAYVILTHSRYDIAGEAELMAKMTELAEYAVKCNISRDKIFLDPGVGFTERRQIDIDILKHLNRYSKMDYPIVLGCSRKRVIESILSENAGDRLEGTLATSALAAINHVGFVRVHDVAENRRIIDTIETLRSE